jgi:hypothetical protein
MMRTLLVVVAAFLSFAASAVPPSSNITDMWWNPAESGWGVNVILQNDVAFLTFFLYNPSQNPIWYTSDIHYQGSSTWSGTLYASTGPWFVGAFNQLNVTRRVAGTVRFALINFDQATLTYTVDGISVTKTVERQTWTNDDYSGTYSGGYSIRLTNCSPSSFNGIQETAGILAVSQNGANLAMTAASTVGVCSFVGTYIQLGRNGTTQMGSYNCTDGTRGTFTASEMSISQSGFSAKVAGQNQFCQWSGYLGGIARAP